MIKDELQEVGRSIDEDHYGATIAYRIGSADDDAVVNSPFINRTGIGKVDVSPLLCIGDAQTLIDRIRAYIAEGASKFVLFPIAAGDADVFEQTRIAIDEVKPEVEN